MTARWLRLLLGFAPRSFRARYLEDLVTTYEARRRTVAPGWGALFVTSEMVGAAWLVVRLRVASLAGVTLDPRVRGFGGTWQDARYALRSLRRNPGFALGAVTIIAVGIGANTAIYSAVNAYFLRPLPFAEPDRLVTVFETNQEFGWLDAVAAPANLLDWREQVGAFADVSGYSESPDAMTAFRDGEPVIVTGTDVMGNFFSTLGVPAALGRTFRAEETWSDEAEVLVISHDLWVRHYGADPDVIGRTFEFATHSPEVVGVMPEGFSFPHTDIELWYPTAWDRAATEDAWFRRAHFIRAFARLEAGVALSEADAQLQVVVERLQREYPATNATMGAGITPMRDFLVREARTPVLVLLGAVWLLLLLACTNVANLMLVRAGERSREVALRQALGAGRLRLVRQMLMESFLLAALGGALGLALGWVAVRSASASFTLGIGGVTSLSMDHRVVLFTCGTAVLSAILFGMAPALRGALNFGQNELSGGPRGATYAGRGQRTAGALVAVEVALAVLLVAGAGLMTRTFWSLDRVDPGFRAEGVFAARFAVQAVNYPEVDQVLSFYDRFAEALEARPGVERVGQVGQLPLAGANWSSQFQAEGWPADRVGVEILHRRADTGYFEALRVPLLRGRMFGPQDGAGTPRVVLINEAFAREHFPGEDPVGQRIAFDRAAGPESTWHEIVGIVGDQHQVSLSRPPRAEVFEHRDQDWGRNNWTVIRVDGEPTEFFMTVRDVLSELDPRIPLAAVRTLESVKGESMAREGLVLGLLGAFGLVALLLAALGVYGVTSIAARRRTREIGIRLALGARTDDVLSLALRRSMSFVVIGLVVGLAGSLFATRMLGSLLYGVEPTDPGTLAVVAGLLGAVAMVACYLPARRAIRVDPAITLRME